MCAAGSMMPQIGCDIVEIARLQEKTALAKRILSAPEYQQYQSLKGKRKTEFLAGRFAAREAIVKALPISLKSSQIEIDPLKEIRYEGYRIQVSISHDGDYAMAVAVAQKEAA
ncbi:holo-ACP synthase [uncultured Faecalicoccus sp.]|uniref:holo-ACP synthase n=1 Tax=uncultured Faecalicoccus sp. TaxID=1971760 RepID=UPI0025F50E07|nr:holo-ACP synthase [uncultured Faecalicoccus sp.]